MRFDETVRNYDDSLNAVVYRQTPQACDSVAVKMGENVDLYFTLDLSKVPVKEETEETETL